MKGDDIRERVEIHSRGLARRYSTGSPPFDATKEVCGLRMGRVMCRVMCGVMSCHR